MKKKCENYLFIYLFLDIIYSTYERKTHTAMYHATQQTIRYLFSKVSCPASNIVTLALSPGKWNIGDGNFFSVKFLAIVYVHTICYQFVLWQMKQNCLGTDMLHYFSLKTIITHSTYLKKNSVFYLMSFFFQIRAFLTNCVQTEIMINKSIASMK